VVVAVVLMGAQLVRMVVAAAAVAMVELVLHLE
jgi:hypothetical protein